jgi:hypothetical protein
MYLNKNMIKSDSLKLQSKIMKFYHDMVSSSSTYHQATSRNPRHGELKRIRAAEIDNKA